MIPTARLWTALILTLASMSQVQPVHAQQDLFNTFLGIGVNVLLNEAARQEKPANPGPATSQRGGNVVDPQVYAVQQKLDALGYDVGTPDGVTGSKTRRAISAYQVSLGAAPTGELTAEQMSQLMGGAGPSSGLSGPSAVQTGTALLPDTDLPGNDYRSGMTDPALKRIDLGTCQAICEADGQCRAFTFNSQASVCFLKSAAGTPTPFRGAISGTKGGPGGLAAPSRDLSRSEVAQLQAALNARGYDVGEPDGVAGSKTATAVAAFLANHPGIATPRLDTTLLTAVLDPAAASVTATAEFAASGYSSFDDAFQRKLALIAIALDPRRLEDDYLLEQWFTRDNPRSSSSLRKEYDDANSVDRAALLDRFGQQILAEAQAFVADPANAELKVSLRTWVGVGTYVPEEGIAVGRPDKGIFAARRFDEFIDLARTSFVGTAMDIPERLAVAVENEAEASAFLDAVAQKSGSNVVLTAWLTLGNFGEDTNVEGAAAADPDEVPLTVTLDRITLQSRPVHNNPAAPGDEELAVLFEPAASATSEGYADSIALARALGVPVIDGRMVMVGNSRAEYPVDGLVANGNYFGVAARFFNLAGMARSPEIARDQLTNEAILNLMSSNQRIRIFGQDRPGGMNNEFERRRALAVYNDQILPELLAATPTFPVPVVVLHAYSLGEYSFTRQAFPIDAGSGGADIAAFRMPVNIGDMNTAQTLLKAPTFLEMDEASAEEFIRSFDEYDRPQITVATFGTLDLTANGNALTVTPESMAIYAYLDGSILGEHLAALDPAEYYRGVTKAETATNAGTVLSRFAAETGVQLLGGDVLFPPEGAPGYEATARLATLFLLAADFAQLNDRDRTLEIAHQLGLDIDPYLSEEAASALRDGSLVPTFEAWAGKDEHWKNERRQDFIADYRDRIQAMLPPLPLNVAVVRPVELGAYDAENGLYPLTMDTVSAVSATGGPVRAYLNTGYVPAPSLPVGAEDAAGLDAALAQTVEAVADATYFAGLDLGGNDLALATSYTVTGVTTDRGVTLEVTERSRALYRASNMSQPLLRVAAVDPNAPEPLTPEQMLAQTGSLDAPMSTFDIFGIKLGMDLDEAKALIEERFKDRNIVPLQQSPGGGGALTSCRHIELTIDEELAASGPGGREAILASHAAEQLEHNCPALILRFAFGYDVELEDGLFDRIIVLQAFNSGQIVGGIIREVPGDYSDRMRQGLEDKYGSNFYDAGTGDQIWLDTGSQAVFDQNLESCTPRWPDYDLPSYYMTVNCGALIRWMYDKVMLIDTRYNALQYQSFMQRLAAAEAIKEPVKIEF